MAAAAAAAAAAVVTSETFPNAPEPSFATRRRSESLGAPPFLSDKKKRSKEKERGREIR